MDYTVPSPKGPSDTSRARKAETLLCWLFGHKFFADGIGSRSSVQKHSLSQSIEALDTCIRCGVTKGELEKQDPRGESRTPKRQVGEAEGGDASKAA
jgi:hypothetical protein